MGTIANIIPGNTISQLIQSQLPQFVRESYPTFIAFLQAYWAWMEEQGNPLYNIGNMLSYADIDQTLPQFVQYFQEEFIPSIPNSVLANKATLIKHAKQFYRAKG